MSKREIGIQRNSLIKLLDALIVMPGVVEAVSVVLIYDERKRIKFEGDSEGVNPAT